MRILLTMAVAFTLLLSAHAEDIPYILGSKVTKQQIEAAMKQEKDAKKVLDLAKLESLKRNKGQYIVVLPGEVTGPLLWLSSTDILTRIDIKKGQAYTLWGIPEGKTEYELINFPARDTDWSILMCGKEGNDRVTAIKNGTATTPPVVLDKLDVTVGPIKPGPGPDPGPTPPPGPGPIPIPGQGFRVLVVMEGMADGSMTQDQKNALSSLDVREYLNAKCVKENGQPEWRFIDKNVEISRLPKVWQDAMNRWKDPAKNPGAKVPWILVTNGTEGFEGELPANTDALLTLLKTYGK